ncbi:hypothetical protein GCM10025787_55150 [Saccharopolyspora rosea]
MRLAVATRRFPRLVEGPLSVAMRLLWLPLFAAVLLGCWAELLVVLVLLPLVLIARASGLGSWWVDVRAHGRRVGAVRVHGYRAARRLRRGLREHLSTRESIDGAERLLHAEQAEFRPVRIDEARWWATMRSYYPYGRRRWFPWQRRLSFLAALDRIPDGLGDDPVSFLIAIPFLLLFALLCTGAAVELAVLVVLLPAVVLLRLGRALPWPVERVVAGGAEVRSEVRGLLASVRARRALDAELARTPPPPNLVGRVRAEPARTR